MRTTSVVALALASIPITPALAGHYHEETEEEKALDQQVKDADASPHAQYGLGPRFGTFHVGPIYDLAFGFTFEGGVRLDRLALLADYTLLGITDAQTTAKMDQTTGALATDGSSTPAPSSNPGGLVQRLGANARYSVAKFMEAYGGTGARGDLFVEGGFGEQLIRWSGGGFLHRADISLGAGFSIQFRGPHHHGGYQLGVRVTLASPPEAYQSTGPATCAGPCDTPTGQMNIDRSIVGGITVIFGD